MTTRFCPCAESQIVIRPSGLILCGKCGLPFKPAAEKVPDRP